MSGVTKTDARFWVRLLPPFVQAKLASRRDLHEIIANTFWLFADRLLRMGLSLVIGVWVSRYLGPVQYGALNYALAFVTLFGVFASLGLDSIIIRDLVRDPTCARATLSTAFALKLVGALLAVGIVVPLAFWLRPGDPLMHAMIAIVAAGTLFQAFDVIDFWFQSQVQSKFTVYARNAAFLIAIGVRALLLWANMPLIAFAWVLLLESALGAIGLVLIFWKQGQRIRLHLFSAGRAKELLHDSWPLIIAGLAVTIYMKIDQIMLGQMLGDQAVGIYAAATRLSELWYFIPVAITSSMTPAIIAAKHSSEAVYYQTIRRLFGLMSLLAIVIALPLTFLAGPLVQLLFGSAYGAAGPILAVHIWASIFVFLGTAQSPWDVNEGLTKLALQRTVLGAIMNVVLNLLLIPPYGGMGSAIATVIAYAFSAVILNGIDRRTRPIFVLQLQSLWSFRRNFK